jgi:agmatinase
MNNIPYENNELNDKDIVVQGVPFDSNSSFMRGSALAPVRIKKSLLSESSNLCTERGYDLGTIPGWHFLPDLVIPDEENAFTRIEDRIAGFLGKNLRVIALGGDHSITIPLIRAHAVEYPKLNILHFDAHPDLYDELDGNRYSHACPFARIMEENLAQRLVQVGIRTLTKHQFKQAERFGVEIIPMDKLGAATNISFDGPTYISLDMDCLDPAFAPGVSHHEPGGMSTRDVLELIKNVKGQIVGADIVEYNPERDINGVTGMVAGKLLKEIIARILENTNPDKCSSFMNSGRFVS